MFVRDHFLPTENRRLISGIFSVGLLVDGARSRTKNSLRHFAQTFPTFAGEGGRGEIQIAKVSVKFWEQP